MENLRAGQVDRYAIIRNIRWSPSEKSVARVAFDRALHRDCEAVIREVQRRAAALQGAADLWRLEDYLRERRKEIGSRYDYGYSVLPFVFAELISAGRLKEEELHGLSEEKLAHIRSLAAH